MTQRKKFTSEFRREAIELMESSQKQSSEGFKLTLFPIRCFRRL